MARQAEMFDVPPRPRVARMHVCDAGNCEDASCVQFECAKCGHRSEWVRGMTVTEAKRGLPCPVCNDKR